MAVTALLAKGLKLLYSSDGTNFTELADCRELGPLGSSKFAAVEQTALTSAAREFAAGIEDAGELNGKQLLTKTRLSWFSSNAGKTLTFKYLIPDAALDANKTKGVFSGFVQSYSPSAVSDPDGNLMIDFSIKISGTVTITEGS